MELRFKAAPLKGDWFVYSGDKEIGRVMYRYNDTHWHIINNDCTLSKRTYSSRDKAAQALSKRVRKFGDTSHFCKYDKLLDRK